MTETIQKTAFTWKDYAALPDDGKVHQVIDGELIVSPAPRPDHQSVQMALSYLLYGFVRKHDLGAIYTSPIDLRLGPKDIVQPDILFIRKDRLDIVKDQIVGPPDLVVEILSPSAAQVDATRKRRRYARFGVRHFWLVNLDERVVICYRLAGKKYERVGLYEGEDRFTHELFKGLTIELATLWPKR